VNKIEGHIVSITSSENISLVDITSVAGNLSAIVIGTPQTLPYLKENQSIWAVFKESEVSLGKNVSGLISLRNQLECKVLTIEHGIIFSKISLNSNGNLITSLITTRSAKRLSIEPGDSVTAFIKANEVLLMLPDHD